MAIIAHHHLLLDHNHTQQQRPAGGGGAQQQKSLNDGVVNRCANYTIKPLSYHSFIITTHPRQRHVIGH